MPSQSLRRNAPKGKQVFHCEIDSISTNCQERQTEKLKRCSSQSQCLPLSCSLETRTTKDGASFLTPVVYGSHTAATDNKNPEQWGSNSSACPSAFAVIISTASEPKQITHPPTPTNIPPFQQVRQAKTGERGEKVSIAIVTALLSSLLEL